MRTFGKITFQNRKFKAILDRDIFAHYSDQQPLGARGQQVYLEAAYVSGSTGLVTFAIEERRTDRDDCRGARYCVHPSYLTLVADFS